MQLLADAQFEQRGMRQPKCLDANWMRWPDDVSQLMPKSIKIMLNNTQTEHLDPMNRQKSVVVSQSLAGAHTNRLTFGGSLDGALKLANEITKVPAKD